VDFFAYKQDRNPKLLGATGMKTNFMSSFIDRGNSCPKKIALTSAGVAIPC
jgi:hypothetical protein